MLLNKGLIRVGIGIPAGAEFELVAADDPYGFASAKELSLFRRPLPTANIEFLSTVMWDGRETFKDAKSLDCTFGTTNCFASLHFSLDSQSNAATVTHAEGTQPLTEDQRKGIIDFQRGVTAQVFDRRAGHLTAQGVPRRAGRVSGEPLFRHQRHAGMEITERVCRLPNRMTAYTRGRTPDRTRASRTRSCANA